MVSFFMNIPPLINRILPDMAYFSTSPEAVPDGLQEVGRADEQYLDEIDGYVDAMVLQTHLNCEHRICALQKLQLT